MSRAPVDQAQGSEYLDRLLRRASFEALWPLFALAERPAKELTESYSALVHLRPFLTPDRPQRVLHVGDGAHARTAALFALKTHTENLAVDPALNLEAVGAWRDRFGIQRFAFRRARIEDVLAGLRSLPPLPTLVTFVHAHVAVDEVLAELSWSAAFTLVCCMPGKQASTCHRIHEQGSDPHVLSGDRRYQVLVPGSRR